MKTLNSIKGMPVLFVLLLLSPVLAFTQKENDVKKMVESGNYIFVAQFALPMSGSTVSLTSEEDLAISPDTVAAYLPYYGRAYQAPLDPSQGGINFTSLKFDYKITNNKKGGWYITIIPKDVTNTQKLSLDVTTTGQARLQVLSVDRQPITFIGYLKENSQPQKAF